ncbi:MAG: hypothetical protein CVU48_01775 [Candidatus Cloacimonetes bacterium HGW-Cloacimonetes-1]|jgi:hypothetical protein|nr:MAG: hypothetical protein CVU48_01775 [Candidatus Cloacimonetes bacterium HGW-Cloacimonetes-1]
MKDFSDLKVVNIGLESFAQDLVKQGVPAIQVKWSPPAAVPSAALDRITASQDVIDIANRKVIDIIQAGAPVLLGLDIALKVIPGMHSKLILHAGPPITWERMCGPMRGAIMGALIYEGLAPDADAAEALAASGEIEYSPCHEHNAVGPMAGIISASMPVFIVQNESSGNYAYCTQNEGLGKVLRYGAFSPEVVSKLKWMQDSLYPILDKAIRSLGKIDLKSLIAQALHMGDEVHNRNRAGTSLLIRQLAPAILRTSDSMEESAKALEFINGNDHFFLNLSMPAAKCILDAAAGIEHSSILTCMARNGTDFGIRLSGTGNEWFTGKALVPDALYFPGYTKDDANPDIGDSAITESVGWGGFAIAAAPAIVQFVGGNAADALSYTQQMYEISASEHQNYQIPALDFRGTPLGIDVVKVINNNLTPFIDTGVAHKNPGIGQVGAGVVSAPIEPFIKAFEKFAHIL